MTLTVDNSLQLRLRAIADVLLRPASSLADRERSEPPGRLLEALVGSVQPDCQPDRVWLLCTAVFGAYPTPEDVRATMRYLQLSTPVEASRWLLQEARRTEAALVQQRFQAARQEILTRRAAKRAAVANRYPLVAKAGRRVVAEGRRRPQLRRVAGFSWRRLLALRRRLGPAGARVRRHVANTFAPPAPDTPPDPELAGWSIAHLQLVTDQVIADVDQSARNELHTGIQQVVRRTLPLWVRDHAVVPAAWMTSSAGLRPLSRSEKSRVLNWAGSRSGDVGPPPAPTLVVPWQTVVIMLESLPIHVTERMAALAQYSGNAVVAVGYDCIPVVSADLVPPAESERFARYLSVLKFARRIAAVSGSAAAEFGGFASALPAQGLTPPVVFECRLPAESGPKLVPEAVNEPPPGAAAAHGHEPLDAAPVVLCVGVEPRKNPLALLYAAEKLWREELAFDLRFVAGSAWGDEALGRIAELRALGRKVVIATALTDSEVESAYREARFSVFASLHEGYGLPVAESLAFGTPVITSNYGSTREIATGGGAVLVDPRDDEALVAAMRRLLTDDDLVDALRREIAARPVRTWEQYADELWERLVIPELPGACYTA
jgi:glycosyltransferase involved in cell wall biosynthesis